MFDELDGLPLDEVNRRVLEEISHHRAQISKLGRYRAARVAAEADRRGHGGAVAIAKEIGAKPVTVYRLIDEERKRRQESDSRST